MARAAAKRPKSGAPAGGSRKGRKTTRAEAIRRRPRPAAVTAAERIGRKLDAMPDRVDIRDWFYQPTLAPLPDQLVNIDLVPAILDQGQEGACTGFALAAVVNFLLARRGIQRRVSPRMLYELARRYDEWPGERYEGSSARGAMKGWVRHGVCEAEAWPNDRTGAGHFTPGVAQSALANPGGAFYRVMHRQVRDMHAALAETGILYVTLMVHGGWSEPGPRTVTVTDGAADKPRRLTLPVITRQGKADGGHAVAIVGYTREGFVIQNSWGKDWGKGGFALLPYEDYMLHATDVWAAQLGVPVSVDVWQDGGADTTSGIHRASRAIPLNEIRPFVIDVGNNGELSASGNYWTTEADVARLFSELIPAASAGWRRRRVLLYLHGGLNDEMAVARRIVAFRDVCIANEIYPLHVMWESGVGESLNGMIRDLFTDTDERAGGVADWIGKMREGLIEAKDLSLELTAALPGGALWREMQENARLASTHPDGNGGMQIVARFAKAALETLPEPERQRFELHVVGHSAGGIFAAHALPAMVAVGVSLKTVQLMAPAMTVRLFRDTMLPAIKAGRMPQPSLYLLSDRGERDDTVGPYGKSLLYLVSNAFEERRATPLLGMARFVSEPGPDRDEELARLLRRPVDGRAGIVIAGAAGGAAELSQSETHGGFDNDAPTLNSVLHRILGVRPSRPFTVRDLQY